MLLGRSAFGKKQKEQERAAVPRTAPSLSVGPAAGSPAASSPFCHKRAHLQRELQQCERE